MSLILEALRKSEAERRRGLPPDLHAELPPVRVRRTRALPAWWWALLAVVAIALAWWLLRTPPAPLTPPSEVIRPAAPPAESGPSIAAAPVATPAAPALIPQPAPAAPSLAATPTPAPPPSRFPDPGPAASSTTTSPIPPPSANVPRASAAAPGRVLSLAELDADTRQALPPLALSMHLWNEDPGRRFVILDGRRMGEGDRIGEASIVRIERDGVLLEWHGRGIRVPID